MIQAYVRRLVIAPGSRLTPTVRGAHCLEILAAVEISIIFGLGLRGIFRRILFHTVPCSGQLAGSQLGSTLRYSLNI